MDKKELKKTVLGRGLDALISANETVEKTTTTNNNTENTHKNNFDLPFGIIPIEQIETNPYQPRTDFDKDALQELADSILEQGIIQPLTVRKLSDSTYQLISGERRLQASKIVGLKEVPAFIRVANDEQMMEMALIENIQRADLNSIEIAIAYNRLMKECKLTLEKVGEKVGKNRSTVNNYLRLLKLSPEIQAALRDNKISMGHAKPLITIDNPLIQNEIFKQIIEQEWSVRRVEEEVKNISKPKEEKVIVKPESKKITPYEIQIRELANNLSQKYATKVAIAVKEEGKGEIKLSFYSDDDLSRLLEILGKLE